MLFLVARGTKSDLKFWPRRNVINHLRYMHSENVTEKNCGRIPKDSQAKPGKEFRVNNFNIQLLSKSLHKQIFKESNDKIDHILVDSTLYELQKHGLPGPLQNIPNIDLKLPDLFGANIEEHFYELGRQQSGPYKELVDSLVKSEIPQMPDEWHFAPGWTRYSVNGPEQIDYPDEDVLVFDVETCLNEGQNPTMATALGKYWYSWASKDLYEGKKKLKKDKHEYTTKEMIPLESSAKINGALGDSFLKPKIVIGHNVSYDRARVKEQYWPSKTGTRFLDTMSLHVCISGVTSIQKNILKSKLSRDEPWFALTSLNSLSEVYKLYCKASLLKSERDVFLTGKLEDVKSNVQSLFTYCANDVLATYKILTHMWPIFLNRFPHPVTLAGMLELSISYLPVNQNWYRYLENAQQTYDDLNIEAKLLLSQQADKCCQLANCEKYKNDLWLWDQNWELKELKLKKVKKLTKKEQASLGEAELSRERSIEEMSNTIDEYDRESWLMMEKKFSSLMSTDRLPAKMPYLAGYPEWYRKLCLAPDTDDWRPGAQQISTSIRIVPKLLFLTWNFMPLHYVREHGWCYIVPHRSSVPFPDEELLKFPVQKLFEHFINVTKSKQQYKCENVDLDNLFEKIQKYLYWFSRERKTDVEEETMEVLANCGLVKLPHKDGGELNVGNPLARDFINKFSEQDVGRNQKTERIIEINRKLSYWKNNHDRIENQLIVWLNGGEVSMVRTSFGVILPQVVVAGTVTRRATERTWMTASNVQDERVGSELRAMIQAPTGYCFVGADVDSQELWLAAVMGDAYHVRAHGGTAFGWMTLSGSKADGTDMHSVTAKNMGISRKEAKIVNYARIYGAGVRFAERLLTQFAPGTTLAEARRKATTTFLATKGQRVYELKPNVMPDLKQRTYTKWAATELCKLYNKEVNELFYLPKWKGGSESAMFNCLENIAYSRKPRTPFLSCRLSAALEPGSHPNDHSLIPTRINWVVQSGAVDFLHLMLVCMRWLIGPRIRFCLSFHDEVRYMVPEKEKYRVALALHVTNLLVRAFCAHRLGMRDLPQSVAFFSSVEVDTVLRKEANSDAVTPSNPHGLMKGYGVPYGESLDISEAIQKADGVIGLHDTKSKKSRRRVKRI